MIAWAILHPAAALLWVLAAEVAIGIACAPPEIGHRPDRVSAVTVLLAVLAPGLIVGLAIGVCAGTLLEIRDDGRKRKR
jgi:hypothetical protein